MKYEYITYSQGIDYNLFIKLKRSIPNEIKNEFIRNKIIRSDNPYVEKNKSEVIRYLDTLFNINETFAVNKCVHIEIDDNEIQNYSHFYICPIDLDMGQHFIGKLLRPACEFEACSLNSNIVTPIIFTNKRAKRIGIAQIFRPWGRFYELVVASWLKQIFEDSNITGLQYEQCLIDDSLLTFMPEIKTPYLAIIKHKIFAHVTKIHVGQYICPTHSIISGGLFRNLTLSKNDLKYDFQVVDGVIANNKKYYYPASQLVVSRKLLDLLIKYDVRGLTDMGFFLKTKFRPVVF